VQGTSWADGLELVGDDDLLVGFAGVLPLRLLAQRSGLRAGLSAAMARPWFDPVYDRGQVLIDLALTHADLTTTTPPRRSWKEPAGAWNPAPRRDSRTPTLPTNRKP
jgi:hypothetical protein